MSAAEPQDKSNPYSFEYTGPEFREVLKQFIPDGKIQGMFTGIVELVSPGAGPRALLPEAAQMFFAMLAEGDMALTFSAETPLEPQHFANNPTELSLRVALIKLGPVLP